VVFLHGKVSAHDLGVESFGLGTGLVFFSSVVKCEKFFQVCFVQLAIVMQQLMERLLLFAFS